MESATARGPTVLLDTLLVYALCISFFYKYKVYAYLRCSVTVLYKVLPQIVKLFLKCLKPPTS